MLVRKHPCQKAALCGPVDRPHRQSADMVNPRGQTNRFRDRRRLLPRRPRNASVTHWSIEYFQTPLFKLGQNQTEITQIAVS